MILSFRCSPSIKERIDRLVARGLYPNFSAFCQVALENQLLLEETNSEDQDRNGSQEGSPSPSRRRTVTRAQRPVASAQPHENDNDSPPLTMRTVSLSGIQEDLRRDRITERQPFALPEASPDLFRANDNVPVDRWLFGQYNRLLPAKVSIRALCVIASEGGRDLLKLDSASARIAETAAVFGEHLRELDARFSSHRDDALSTAFPETGADGQKGRVRYQNHFVGHTVKGEQGGLLVELKLASIQVMKNKPCIIPTKAGWDFALLENPILDGVASDAPDRFSDAECTFLLEHIRDCVPAERFAYSVILGMIARGVCSPEGMTTQLFALLSPGRDASEAKEFVNTQRSGALGRMTDLGLIAHERNGRNVNRTITPKGRRFLETIGQLSLAPAS